MCLPVNNFFRLLNDYGCEYGCKSFCGCLYCSRLCMVVFVFAHCLASICIISHHTGRLLERLSFPHRLLFNKVVLKISDAIYSFRGKNSWDHQNGWVENRFTWADCITALLITAKSVHRWSFKMQKLVNANSFHCLESQWENIKKLLSVNR